MILPFLRNELLLPLVAAEGMTLPDPKDFASVGWAIAVLFFLIKGADAVLNFYKRHIKQSIPSGDWASQKALDDLRVDVHNQIKESRTYMHEQLHELRNALHDIQTSGEVGREGLHNRLSTIVELVHYQRGQNEGLLKASEITASAADRAAKSAEAAAARCDDLSRRPH